MRIKTKLKLCKAARKKMKRLNTKRDRLYKDLIKKLKTLDYDSRVWDYLYNGFGDLVFVDLKVK